MSDAAIFDPKDPEEVLDLTFYEAERLDGATIVSGSPVVTISALHDKNASDMLLGDPVISGTNITQRVMGGLPGGTYAVRLAFNTSDGRHLVEPGLLPVRVLGTI